MVRGVVPLRHVPPPDGVATLVNSFQNRVKSITLCVILNAKKWEIVLVTLCIQIEWLFIMLSVWNCNTKVTLTPSKARGHVPTLLQMTGHGGIESKKNKKQESDQTVLTTRKRLPKRLIVLAKPKKWRDTTKNFSGASRLTCASHF